MDLKQRQSNTVAMVTFWSQLAAYSFMTIFILYLTRSTARYGLGYSEIKAYAFMGVTMAMGYLMPILGGSMADSVVGLRRGIFVGAILLAAAYLLVMLSGFTVKTYGDTLFVAAYALIPVINSLLMGPSSALVSRIFREDEVRSKGGMTIYYMSINLGALVATILAPQLMKTHYGPLSIFGIVFLGKTIAALNFYWRYNLYDNVIAEIDRHKMPLINVLKLTGYIVVFYLITITLYFHPYASSYVIGVVCALGILWFLIKTMRLSGVTKTKQLIAILLIVEAIVFFVLYNQMNSTLVLFAKNNSNLNLLGFTVAPANYLMVNPIVIIILSLLLPTFYKKFHNFNIPYQFAAGTALSGIGLLTMWFACVHAHAGIANGNFLVLTYFLITISELWVSAIGLSMIGLYCDVKMLGFAMGAWYLSASISSVLSGRLAGLVALPKKEMVPSISLPIYEKYFLTMGVTAFVFGVVMFVVAIFIIRFMRSRQLKVV